MDEQKTKKSFFIEGAISPERIAGSITSHSKKTGIGAHEIFLGQVREKSITGKNVTAILFEIYEEMAQVEIERIREETIVKHQLTCAHVLHSKGHVNTGEICFFVFVSAPHRQAVFEACSEMVNRIKREVPIFGREIFNDQSYQWKENN